MFTWALPSFAHLLLHNMFRILAWANIIVDVCFGMCHSDHFCVLRLQKMSRINTSQIHLELPGAAGQVLADASSARVCQQSSQDLVAECGEWLWAEAHEPSWPYCSPGYLSCTRFRADWSLFVNGRAVDGCHVPVCAQAARAFWNGSDKDLPFLLDFLLRDLPQQHTASVTRLQPLSVNLRKMVYRMSSWVCFFGTLPPRSLGMIPGPVDCLLALSCKVHNPTVGFGPLMLFRMNSW